MTDDVQLPLGDYMKILEGQETDRRAVKGLPLLARLDGRAFHSFTRSLNRPFDKNLTELMIQTTIDLVEEFHPLFGYTQSDEISLVWNIPANHVSDYMFGGRYQKLVSILAAAATVNFKHNIERGYLPGKEGTSPIFDCRVWQVPSIHDAYLALLWRERDATKNSVTMLAHAYFSDHQLMGVTTEQRKQMLLDVGVDWEQLEPCYRKGTIVKRVATVKPIDPDVLAKIPKAHRPVHTNVERVEIRRLNLPPLKRLDPKIESLLFKNIPLDVEVNQPEYSEPGKLRHYTDPATGELLVRPLRPS